MSLQPILKLAGLERRPPFRGTPIALELSAGQVLGLLGPSHSGKSELAQNIAGMQKPYRGRVTVLGQSVRQSNGLVGYVPYKPGAFRRVTCSQYLEFFADSFVIPHHYRPALIREALARVEMAALADLPVEQLNLLDQQRLDIARAVVHNPSVIVIQNIVERFEVFERQILLQCLQNLRQLGKVLVVGASCWTDIRSICSHLCILASDGILAFGPVSTCQAALNHLKMYQLHFYSGMPQAIRILNSNPHVYHLSQSTQTQSVLKFLYDERQQPFDELLEAFKAESVAIVGIHEDRTFPGLN